MVTPGTPGQRRDEWKAGWHIPAISALGIGVSMIPVYSLGPLMPAIHAGTGWSRSDISTAAPFLSVGAVLLSPVVGMAIDRFGSRRIAIPGLIFFCAAFASLALTTNRIATWRLAWTLIAVTVVFVKIMVWTAAVVSRFQFARGTAVGLALTGTGLASFLVPYLTTVLESLSVGTRLIQFWREVVFSSRFRWSICTSSTRTMRLRRKASVQIDRSTLPGLPLREAFLSRHFVQMALAALLSATAGTGLTIHFVPILRSPGSFTAHCGGCGWRDRRGVDPRWLRWRISS